MSEYEDEILAPQNILGGQDDQEKSQLPFSKNYFAGQATEDASGFKYRVSGESVVRRTLDALQGATRDEEGNLKYEKKFRLMNPEGLSRAKLFMEALINQNTHLSRFRDEQRVLRQIKSLSKEWVVTVATNRKRWQITEPDLIQQIMEQTILISFNRADEGFEAELSAKSHHVMEQVHTGFQNQKENQWWNVFK